MKQKDLGVVRTGNVRCEDRTPNSSESLDLIGLLEAVIVWCVGGSGSRVGVFLADCCPW